jgi:hypothetical protein
MRRAARKRRRRRAEPANPPAAPTAARPAARRNQRSSLLPLVGEEMRARRVRQSKKTRARPSPVNGRRWPHVVGSDEGCRGLVGTSPGPSSDLASRGHLLPRVGEGMRARRLRQSRKARTRPSPASGRRKTRLAPFHIAS